MKSPEAAVTPPATALRHERAADRSGRPEKDPPRAFSGRRMRIGADAGAALRADFGADFGADIGSVSGQR
ncbi:helix-turn-helix domain protein [Streptomyces laurentii]|uniref:Helix-turn-helix domain protein n=1 Tax=Streptomyces laurentii TaxID=39478 RepID=A0A160NYJ6_STRLU|nr:helix-turn-helix domain protein [Streptomyces laurentii]